MRGSSPQPILVVTLALALAIALVAPALKAEPQAPTEEQFDDASFAKSFIGKNYDDELEIEGWEDLGGGLVTQPIFVHEYQREDGTYLVLTSRQLAKGTR